MRIALLSDIHGNPIALEAVLADIDAQGGAAAYWVLGDLAAIGPAPVAVLEWLAGLPNARFVRGNTDRYTVTGERPPRAPTAADAQADAGHLQTLLEIARSFAWTQGALAATGWLDWLADLPLEQRLVLPDGTRLLGVHASPGRDDDPGVPPDIDDGALRSLLHGCEADLVCVGHTHRPLDRLIDGIRVVNIGSVSNPFPPDLRASYVLLDADERGYRIEHRRADYDRGAVLAALERARHPATAFVAGFMLGHQRPSEARR